MHMEILQSNTFTYMCMYSMLQTTVHMGTKRSTVTLCLFIVVTIEQTGTDAVSRATNMKTLTYQVRPHHILSKDQLGVKR